MTIQLSFLTDLRRVRISLSNLLDGSVRLERALNPAATDPMWSVVRGGRSLAIVDGVAELDDYEWVSDVDNWYRVVPVDPPAGLFLPGQSGDYANTPDTAALDITGDIDIRADLTLDNWLSTTPERWIITKYEGSGNQRSFAFGFRGDDLEFRWSTDGTSANLTTINPTKPVPVSAGRLAVRVTLDVNNGAGGWTARFYTAPTIDGPWEQLGDPVTNSGGGTTSIHAGTATLAIGAFNTGTVPLDGVIHSVEVRNGIGGTLVANPDFAAQPPGITQFTDGTGKVWTVHGNARIVGVEIASIKPSLDGEVWLRSVRYPHLSRPVMVQTWGELTRHGRGFNHEVSGRQLPIGVTDVAGSLEFPLTIVTRDIFDRNVDGVTEAAALDMMLSLGGEFHLHVPPERTFPGGYFVLERSVQDRIVRKGDRAPRVFTIPVRFCARPDPDIVGTTLTWGTVNRLFGSWEALVAAHPDWAQLLAVVGDPEDLVVI